jgi:hypothetical protein
MQPQCDTVKQNHADSPNLKLRKSPLHHRQHSSSCLGIPCPVAEKFAADRLSVAVWSGGDVQPRPGWAPDPRWAGGWACLSHPGVLGSIPKRHAGIPACGGPHLFLSFPLSLRYSSLFQL